MSSTTHKKLLSLVERDGVNCCYCNKECSFWMTLVPELNCHYNPDKMTIEHIIPKSYGGNNDIRNLIIACNKCNKNRKDDFTIKVIDMIRSFPTDRKDYLLGQLINPKVLNNISLLEVFGLSTYNNFLDQFQ